MTAKAPTPRAHFRTRASAMSAARTAPLSVLFATLIANCTVEGGGTCSGPPLTLEEIVLASEADFEHFAKSDGILDLSECLALCDCLAPSLGRSPPSFPKLDAATSLDAEAGIDSEIDDGDTSDASDATDDGDATDDDGASDSGETTDAADVGSTMHDAGPVAPRCVQGKRAFVSLSGCAYRGTTSEGHKIACVGTGPRGPVCGRGGACHLHLGRGLGESAVARWLAFAAATEAASIRSFTTLRRELRALGAPANLVSRAHSAARDEAQHARLMLRLAQRWGGTVVRPRSVHLPPRDLEAVATENAVEGCVRETWAALLNHHQAAYAGDTEVRAVMARIAPDETAHAELAHDIDRWAAMRLPTAARTRVNRAKKMAAQALAAELREPSPALRNVLGLPAKDVLQGFAGELDARLWS